MKKINVTLSKEMKEKMKKGLCEYPDCGFKGERRGDENSAILCEFHNKELDSLLKKVKKDKAYTFMLKTVINRIKNENQSN